ncbi:MAG TPA: LacI family DNA-binding transcriptional regulator [bacterium]|nr:LacI family DNA-binding transcriptional regulator [bacterium]HPR88852.1 LacI family DNA-binding transcriptional regulator [bacterium]
MSTTITDIATQAHCSVSTVSRVLSKQAKKYRISREMEERILQVAQKLNYRPNHLARGLRLKQSQTIGLVVPDISNPFFAYVTRIIQTFAYNAGYSLIVCNTDENLQTEIDQIELLRSKGVDGFIIMPVGVRYSHLKELLDDGIPLVLLDRCFDEIQTNSVIVNDYKGAFEAVEHLLSEGHTRIAIVQGLAETHTNRARLRGYLDALAKYGIAPDENLIVGDDFRKNNGYIETKILLRLEQPPSAIFTTSDLITLGALQAIQEEGFLIPEDISLVSFDDTDFAPFLYAPLTAVSQPKELMGEIAVKLLIEDLKSKGQKEKKRIVLEPQLIVRKSVAHCPPIVH